MLFRLSLIAFLALAALSSPSAPAHDDRCQVTLPPNPPLVLPAPYSAREAPSGTFWYGTGALWTQLDAAGTWRGLPHNVDGYRQKVFWWGPDFEYRRASQVGLVVTGRRVDTDMPLPAPRITGGETPEWKSFLISGVDMPAYGCWEFTGVLDGWAT